MSLPSGSGLAAPPSSCSASLVTWLLGFTLSWEDVEQTFLTSPAARPPLSLHLGPCSFLHHGQDGELPGDTHTISFTTEASSWSWVWGQLLPKPVAHARGPDTE